MKLYCICFSQITGYMGQEMSERMEKRFSKDNTLNFRLSIIVISQHNVMRLVVLMTL